MPCEKRLENSLSEVDVWKFVLRTGIFLHPDGFYELNGIFGRSPTFGFLKASTKEVQAIRSNPGSIKEPWLTRLAYFMKTRRSKSDGLAICDNHVLVVLGIMRLIVEANIQKKETVRRADSKRRLQPTAIRI